MPPSIQVNFIGQYLNVDKSFAQAQRFELQAKIWSQIVAEYAPTPIPRPKFSQLRVHSG